MSSGTIKGPQLRANQASIRGPERRPKKQFPYGKWSTVTNEQLAGNEASEITSKQATEHNSSRPARPHHRGLSDAVIHPIGEVDSSHHRGSSDAGVDPSSVT